MSSSGVWLGSDWTDGQRAWFYTACQAEQRDEVVGVLLALFLGSFGAHHFYLRRTGLGVLYLLFFWTGLPGIVSFFECFFMPGRVRRFNWGLTQFLLSRVPTTPEPMQLALPAPYCPGCSSEVTAGARFCRTCGAAA